MKNLLTFTLLIICLSVFGSNDGFEGNDEFGRNEYGLGGWGFKAGLNIATIGGDIGMGAGLENKYGLNISYFNSNPITTDITFEWGVQYSMKGALSSYEYEYYNEIERSESTLNFQYIELPMSFKFTIPTQSLFSPFFSFGAVPGFNIKSTSDRDYYYYYYDDWDGTEYEINDSSSEDITDEVNPFEFGFMFGGGIAIPTQSGKFLIDIKYNYGMTNIPDETSFEMINKVWLLSLGYEFSK